MSSIAVIIVTYNAIPWAERSLLPLKATPKIHKVYIIDNGSTDGTQDFIHLNCPEFIFVQSDTNLGFGKANNLGFNLALKDGCTHFLLLNQDAHISWDSIRQLVEIQKRNINYGILSPIHLYDHANVDRKHLKSMMKKGDEFFNDLIINKELKEIYEIGYTNAAIWLISKDCLRKAGGFEPLFPHYGEDSEYAKRVNYFGFKVGVCPNIKGYHYRIQKNKVDQKKPVTYHFNSFLIQAKNLDSNLVTVYLKIFKQLITSTLGRIIGIKGLACKASWLAYWNLIIARKNILQHRQLTIDRDYSFLKYEE